MKTLDFISGKQAIFDKKNIILAFFVFVIVFCFMGLPFSKMGFDSDSFGEVFAASQEQDLLSVFKKSVTSDFLALNEEDCSINCLSFYRPLQSLLFQLCFYLFGTNSFYYYLFGIFIHAFVCSIVFLIFSTFIVYWAALPLSLLFGFHTAHVPSFVGLICTILYPVYFFLALASLFMLLFLKDKGGIYYYLAGVFYFLSLMSYELPIVFPFILMAYLWLFDRSKIMKAWLFFVVAGVYGFIRLFFFGTVGAVGPDTFSLSRILSNSIASVHQTIKPFWGMQNFPTIFVVLFCFVFIFFIFLYFLLNTGGRKRMFFYTLSFLIASWPIVIANSSSRYFYAAIPFFCLIFYELLDYFSQYISFVSRKTFIITGIMSFWLWGALYAFNSLERRERYTYQRDLAFKELAERYSSIEDIRLIYVGMLHYYNGEIFLMQSGLTQASRLFFNNSDLLAYHVKEAMIYSKYPMKNTMRIEPVSAGYRFISSDPDNLFIMCPYSWNEKDVINFSMGKIIVNKKKSGWQATDITVHFDDKWLVKSNLEKTRFLTWDVGEWKFVELPKNHLL